MGPREFFESIESTQDRAIELARAGAPAGTRVVARSQSQGRGRLDHMWWSPSGAGVYLSIILRSPPPPRSLLSLAVGNELRSTLRDRVGVTPALKWPNDLIVVNGPSLRKLSGILIDEVGSPSGGVAEVVGVGLNVLRPDAPPPPPLQDRFTSIADWVASPPTVEEAERWVVEAVMRASERLRSPEDQRRLLEECRAALYGVGRPARVDGVARGIVDTVGEDGALWLVSGIERVAIIAGDVEVQ